MGAETTFKMEVSEKNKLIVCKDDGIDAGHERHGRALRSFRNMTRMHPSVKDAQKHINDEIFYYSKPGAYTEVTNSYQHL